MTNTKPFFMYLMTGEWNMCGVAVRKNGVEAYGKVVSSWEACVCNLKGMWANINNGVKEIYSLGKYNYYNQKPLTQTTALW